jgi:aspartyl-tRNA(Asn)/glutamyl-tRNA(Gln) amidotransferase subunit B
MQQLSTTDRYDLVIGIEVHAQLLTSSKAYSSDANEFGSMPNENISIITLAHPGTLPRSNEKVIEYAIKMGLALGCDITSYNYYDRKNYFYPDLPKGYQITQDKTPICRGGQVKIKPKGGEPKAINLTRIHMEEDAGKSLHLAGEEDSLIDLNRAGVPLIEIVSEPEITTAEEAYAYLYEIRRLVRYLDICDGNMEEGSLRADVNISLKPKGRTKLGSKVEVKNMNSFRNVMRAIEFEVERQATLLDAGLEVDSETRMFNAETGLTYSLRSKENLNDYRYFPEPDLQPVIVTEAMLADIKAQLPALPQALFDQFTETFGIPEYDANVLTDSKDVALYYVEICKHTTNYKAASNWVMGAIKSYLNELTMSIDQFPISGERIAELIKLVDDGKVSNSIAAQRIFPEMITDAASPLAIATKLNVLQEGTEDDLKPVILQIIEKWPQKVAEFKAGKKGIVGMFMGELMKATKGKSDPKMASALIEKMLTELD